MKQQPSYYAILTADVRYDKNINANAKLLYAEITALTNMNGSCFASNNYFSELYGVDTSTIQRWLKSLEDEGYILRKVEYVEGTKQIKNRYVQLCGHPHRKNEVTPHRKNAQDNNTPNGDKNNNLTDSNNLNKNNIFLEYYPQNGTGEVSGIERYGYKPNECFANLADDLKRAIQEFYNYDPVKCYGTLEKFYIFHQTRNSRGNRLFWEKAVKRWVEKNK